MHKPGDEYRVITPLIGDYRRWLKKEFATPDDSGQLALTLDWTEIKINGGVCSSAWSNMFIRYLAAASGMRRLCKKMRIQKILNISVWVWYKDAENIKWLNPSKISNDGLFQLAWRSTARRATTRANATGYRWMKDWKMKKSATSSFRFHFAASAEKS